MTHGEQSRSHPLAPDVASAHAELRNLVLDGPSVEDFLHELAVVAADLAPGIHCSVTLDRDGRAICVAATNAVAAWLDEIQCVHGDGPGLTAMRTGVQVDVPSSAEERTWAEFARYATARGVGSAVFLPLTVQGDSIGAINLYAPAAGVLAGATLRRAQLVADEAAAGLTLALRRSRFVPDDQLFRALATRRLIDQALGILMHADQVSSRAAFETLLELAHTSNRSLGAVATEVIERTTGERGAADDVTGE
jgi:hypothetical protein